MADGFRGVPGVPEGWEAVRFDYVSQWEFWLDKDGDPIQHTSSFRTQCKQLIIRKIEKAKRYRPFASAEEFEPHRDRWITRKGIMDEEAMPGAVRVTAYADERVWFGQTESTFHEVFVRGVCFTDDGTPFGVEVTDDIR